MYNTIRLRSSYLHGRFRAHKLIFIYRRPQTKIMYPFNSSLTLPIAIPGSINSNLRKIGHGFDSHGQMDTPCLKITYIKGETSFREMAVPSPLGDEE